MDVLKLYAKTGDDLEDLLSTVNRFSDDVGMEFGLEKFANVSFKKSILIKSKNITLDINVKITENSIKPINILELMKQIISIIL